MKIISLLLILSQIGFAGAHGKYILSCTSASLRTHLHLALNDEDFEKEYYPQKIVLSVMGHVNIMGNHDDEVNIKPFNLINNHGILEIYNTDKTYHLKIDFRKDNSAKVTIKRAINPRTNKVMKSLKMTCTKYHDL